MLSNFISKSIEESLSERRWTSHLAEQIVSVEKIVSFEQIVWCENEADKVLDKKSFKFIPIPDDLFFRPLPGNWL